MSSVKSRLTIESYINGGFSIFIDGKDHCGINITQCRTLFNQWILANTKRRSGDVIKSVFIKCPIMFKEHSFNNDASHACMRRVDFCINDCKNKKTCKSYKQWCVDGKKKRTM